jgi:quinohemoprotein ethanol dehydrogenase
VLRSFRLSISFVSLGALGLAGGLAWAKGPPAANVTQQRMENKDAGQWMSYGRTWDEQRYSPLKQINDQNVKQLGLAWL